MKMNLKSALIIVGFVISFIVGFISEDVYAMWFSPSIMPAVTLEVKQPAAPKEICYDCGVGTRQDCPESDAGSWWPDCQWSCEGHYCTCVVGAGCGTQ